MFHRYTIEGDSMLPTLQSGQRVLVKSWGHLRTGDVVVFNKNGLTMVKRLVQKNGDRWTVRGDNRCASTDSIDFGDIDEKNMLGKVVSCY